MKKVTGADLDKIEKGGGTVKQRPKQVEAQVAVDGLAAAFEKLIEANAAQAQAVNQKIISALDRLTATLAKKEGKDIDLTKVVQAIASLRKDAEVVTPEPVDYALDFERDQRLLIKPGTVRFRAIPRTLN